ncbi:MAG: hypothetical protein IPJ74_15410 [Saprospiraceae bacterium]|nr:hypothetical protein [Saprospiraceae bacterium]
MGAVDDPHLMATCSPPIPFAMKRDFPEVEEAVRFVGAVGRDQQLFRYDGKAFMKRQELMRILLSLIFFL